MKGLLAQAVLGGKRLERKNLARDYGFLFGIAGLIVVVDQITKAIVRANLVENVDMWAPWDWLLPYARFVHITNTGVAFGMFQGRAYIFAILATIVALAIIYYFPQIPRHDKLLRVAMSMQLAGALGNLIDRLRQNGAVTDFVSVGNFPVWNVADASITIGVAILILGVLLQEWRDRQSARIQMPQPLPGDPTHEEPANK